MKHTVEEVILNGVKGLFIDVPGTEVLRLQIRFNSGYVFSSKLKYEMPHITEHLLVGGNEDYPDSILFKAEIEKNGAYFNAATNDYFNWYDWETPAFDAERILKLATSQLGKPLIQPEDVTTEKGRVEQEIKGYMSDHYQTLYDALHKYFEGTPTFETRISQLGKISAADMRNYYLRTHTRDNVRFFAVGAVKANKNLLLDGFSKVIESLPAGKLLDFPSTTRRNLKHPLVTERDISQVFYLNNFVQFSTDRHQRAAVSLLAALLSSFLPSSLFGAVWKSGLAYGVSTFFEFSSDHSEIGIVNNVSPTNIEPLFELIVKQMGLLCRDKLSVSELRAIERMTAGEEKVRYQTPGALLSFYAYNYMLFGELITLDNWRRLQSSITVSDIKKALEEILHSGQWAQAFVGPIKPTQAESLYKIMAQLRS